MAHTEITEERTWIFSVTFYLSCEVLSGVLVTLPEGLVAVNCFSRFTCFQRRLPCSCAANISRLAFKASNSRTIVLELNGVIPIGAQ